MFKISELDIKNLSHETAFNRGKQYFKQNKVLNFSTDLCETPNSNHSLIKASAYVEGSYGSVYETIAIVNEFNEIGDYYCDCSAFENYSGPCKHIIALLFKYIEEYNEDNYAYAPKQSVMDFLETGIESILQNSHEKISLCLDVKLIVSHCNTKYNYNLEIKVGENKKYIVKNMKKFLSAVYNKESLDFGKNFSYNPLIHVFKPEDEEIINILLEIYENDEGEQLNSSKYVRLNFNKSSDFFCNKTVSLTSLQFKRLMKYLKNKSFSCEIINIDSQDVEILNEDLPINILIEMDKENIKITHSTFLPISLDAECEYFFYPNKIYNPSKEQVNLYKLFHVIFCENKTINIPMADFNRFSLVVLPALKKVSSDLELVSKCDSQFINSPLESNIYFDKIGNLISAEVVFEYNPIKLNPLKPFNPEQGAIPIRDNEQERKIINLLKEFHFQQGSNEYILTDEKLLFNFLTEGLPRLQNTCNLFYSDSFKKVKIYSNSTISSSVKISNDNLLEFNFNIEGVENTELSSLFKSIKTKKKYYKLKSGGFLLLGSEKFNKLSQVIDYLDVKSSDLKNTSLLIPKNKAFYLDEKFKTTDITIEKSSDFKALIDDVQTIKENDFIAPENIDKILRDYQKIGFKWLKTLSYYGFGGILADEMGLGKTLQAIAFISSIKSTAKDYNPTLVVCPTSLMYNWESEINKFAPELEVKVVSGNKDTRKKHIENIKEDVIITSYPLIRNDIEEYCNIYFSSCFLDEAQYIKNPNSINAKAVKSLKALNYFALTGTPIENSLTELWSIFDFIMPKYLMSQSKFKKAYEIPIVKNNDKSALDELNKHIKPFILRRTKKEVLQELPPKIEHKIIIDLNNEQKKLYAAYVQELKQDMHKEILEKGFKKSKIKILSLLTRLRQICCDPSMFIKDYSDESSKIDALLDIISNSLEENHSILVFSQFTSALKNIKSKLNEKNIDFFYLDGKTNSKDRLLLSNEFNKGSKKVFLISLKAGGTGLNLIGADTVIHFDPWWNPAVENQASDRAHRIGQKNSVEIIKLITKGTIEEKITLLQEKKKNIFDSVVENSNEENLISKMNESEIRSLFDY